MVTVSLWYIGLTFLVILLFLVTLRLSHQHGAIDPSVIRPPKYDSAVYDYGVADHIGMRPYMEDRFLVTPEIHGQWDQSLYAVFDGHGGYRAAQFCADNLGRTFSDLLEDDPEDALASSFVEIDRMFLDLARSHFPPFDDGSTAVSIFFSGDVGYVANAGDSRAVLVTDRGCDPLSQDHKPNTPAEMARIQRLGGRVLFHGVWRVEGVLAVSRAIGDRLLKPYVSATPDMQSFHVEENHRYVVIATDGLWDVVNMQDIPGLVEGAHSAQAAADSLVLAALRRGTTDNVTVLVVDLRKRRCPPQPPATSTSQLSADIQANVESQYLHREEGAVAEGVIAESVWRRSPDTRKSSNEEVIPDRPMHIHNRTARGLEGPSTSSAEQNEAVSAVLQVCGESGDCVQSKVD